MKVLEKQNTTATHTNANRIDKVAKLQEKNRRQEQKKAVPTARQSEGVQCKRELQRIRNLQKTNRRKRLSESAKRKKN